MKYFLSFLIIFSSIGCANPAPDSSKVNNAKASESISQIDLRFDSCMEALMNIYPAENIFTPQDSTRYDQAYTLQKRVYVPQMNLTFDYRKLTQLNHVFAPYIHIYNDSIQFVLPLSDIRYYDVKAMPGNDSKDITKYLNYEPELNKLTKILKFDDKEKLQAFLNEIMNLIHFEQVSSDMDFSIFKLKADAYLSTNAYDDSICDDALKESISYVSKHYKDRDKLVYTNGINIFIYTLKNNGIKVDYLNYRCK